MHLTYRTLLGGLIAAGAAAGAASTGTAAADTPTMGVRWQAAPTVALCELDGDPTFTATGGQAPTIHVDVTGLGCGNYRAVLYAAQGIVHDPAAAQYLLDTAGTVGQFTWPGYCGLQVDLIPKDFTAPAVLLGTPFTDAGVLADSWNGTAGPLAAADCADTTTTTATFTPAAAGPNPEPPLQAGPTTTAPAAVPDSPTTVLSAPPAAVTIVGQVLPFTGDYAAAAGLLGSIVLGLGLALYAAARRKLRLITA